jgi:hypothetical protein
MFTLLTGFELAEGQTIDGFQRLLDALERTLREVDLVDSIGSIGRRVRHPVMDTYDGDHEYFFVMNFRDRHQCDAAVDHIRSRSEPGSERHLDVLSAISPDAVFICWEQVGAPRRETPRR